MKWNRYTIKTTTEAVDLISCMLAELGIEGIEIQDNVQLTQEEEWSLPEDWDVNQLVVYGFAVSANGQNASGTLGLLETNGDA